MGKHIDSRSAQIRQIVEESVVARVLEALAVLLVCMGAAGCRPGAQPPSHPNIAFIVVDTLRADALHSYGNPQAITPAIDALAREGWLFERVVSPSSWTKTSMASIFTSLDPARHGVRSPKHRLRKEHTTLARALQAAGYRTIGLNSNPWLLSRFGFDAGFGRYESPRWQKAPRLFERALALAEASDGRPTFLYIHLMDVHGPYRPSARSFDAPPLVVPGRGAIANLQLQRLYREDEIEGTPEIEERVRDLYEACVQDVDRSLGQFVDALRHAGFLDEAVVVFTADHGEAFGEHGTRTHGWDLYPEVTSVPLIIYAPGRLTAGVRVASQVRSIDIAPTVLALAGVAAPAGFQGESLIRADGRPPEDRIGVAAVGLTDRIPDLDYVAVRSVDHLYVREKRSDAVEFYDLRKDPGATQNLGADHPLVPRYAALEGGEEARAPEDVEIDAQTREELRALGYLIDGEDVDSP